MVELENLRRQYKPQNTNQLFIGESPPANGTFFYCCNSNLYRYTQSAFEQALGPAVGQGPDFLTTFMQLGCYLEDLCPHPLNRLAKADRRRRRKLYINNLSSRIIAHAPRKILIVVRAIVPAVEQAAALAGFDSRHIYSLPFPAQGHQAQYIGGLAAILLSEQAHFSLPPQLG